MIHALAVPVKSLRNAAEETEAGDKHVCVCIFDKVGERDRQRIIHKAITALSLSYGCSSYPRCKYTRSIR